MYMTLGILGCMYVPCRVISTKETNKTNPNKKTNEKKKNHLLRYPQPQTRPHPGGRRPRSRTHTPTPIPTSTTQSPPRPRQRRRRTRHTPPPPLPLKMHKLHDPSIAKSDTRPYGRRWFAHMFDGTRTTAGGRSPRRGRGGDWVVLVGMGVGV